ncbi:MAG TPA: transglycosylase SLT domain-containing protein [Candidatus Sulfotelmatobacter sp.]|nr:transglycosylase SLT domain-containing protein [Candidatus Sulfotelmatobacter sp.]
MTEPVRVISVRRLAALETSRRRLRWGFAVLACCTAGLLVHFAPRPRALEILRPARPAEASTPDLARGERAEPAAPQDPLYDQFLQEYAPLRRDADQRRYIAAQVRKAAVANQVDPDLLFALVAAESSFDSKAVSSKGARGLGQMQFATARAVAPGAVQRPEDLHDVPTNLHATALHLRQLLGDGQGDLRWALRMYYAGTWDPNGGGESGDRYVARVSTFYAYLKAKRAHQDLNPVVAASAVPAARVN